MLVFAAGGRWRWRRKQSSSKTTIRALFARVKGGGGGAGGGRELLPSKTSVHARRQGLREVLVPVDAKSTLENEGVCSFRGRGGVDLLSR